MAGVPALDARYSAHTMVRSLCLQGPGKAHFNGGTPELQTLAERGVVIIDSNQTVAAPVFFTSQTATNIVGEPASEDFEFNLSPPSDVIDQQDDLFAPLFPWGENEVL